jgi:pimeloyl-ACP methyl ester carboxylesterase
VSSRYLDLTKQKLSLTRLPKELTSLPTTSSQWALGVPKSVLEPLLDHWLETYDWRAQEDIFNASLPQYRTLITRPAPPGSSAHAEASAIRTHFVHARSAGEGAVPLLYVHSWPGSFIEAGRLIPLLTAASETAQGERAQQQQQQQQQSFHVVCPSIPGFGFSDAAEDPQFGVEDAAEVFAALMQRLGYEEYVVCGEGWGFQVARALALKQRESVVKGVFTWNPRFERPEWGKGVKTWVQWQVARVTGARWPSLSFGYVPSEVQEGGKNDMKGKETKGDDVMAARPMGPVLHQLLSARPQTLAFSLCDSPVGLLAVLLDVLGVQGTGPSLGARPRSPFLDPEELELQDREYEAAGHERVRSDDTVKASQNGVGAHISTQPWSPTDILNWTMMYVIVYITYCICILTSL